MKRFIALLFAAVLVTMISSCGDGKKKTAETSDIETGTSDDYIRLTKEQFENSGMALGSLKERSFPILVHTNGMIDVPPENRAVVSATMGGYIKTTPLLIGDRVKKGQALVTIENPEFVRLQQDYMEIKQQMNYLQSEYERQETLVGENITSQKSFLKAESEYKTANARYNGLRKQLTMLNISPEKVEQGNIATVVTVYAPISGSITKMNVNRGTYVSPASPILEIIDNEHIHIELAVFEKDIMKVKKGQPIHFKTPEASKETFNAEVYLIGTSIDEKRTIKVHAHLKEESKNNFLTGMFVDATIVVADTNALALPYEAVVTIDDKTYLLLLESETDGDLSFKQVKVEAWDTDAGYSAIKDAEKFRPTDQFLIRGAFDLIGE